MKTSTRRKIAFATVFILLLAGNVLTIGSTSVAPANPQLPSCSQVDDATLATNVKDELAKTFSPRVMGAIEVTSKNRVVTLSGSTNFLGTRTRVGQLARKVRCVRRVINRIKFSPPAQLCSTGQKNCCCPDSGCECVPQSSQCPVCMTKK